MCDEGSYSYCRFAKSTCTEAGFVRINRH
jgi:hypothetical protein